MSYYICHLKNVLALKICIFFYCQIRVIDSYYIFQTTVSNSCKLNHQISSSALFVTALCLFVNWKKVLALKNCIILYCLIKISNSTTNYSNNHQLSDFIRLFIMFYVCYLQKGACTENLHVLCCLNKISVLLNLLCVLKINLLYLVSFCYVSLSLSLLELGFQHPICTNPFSAEQSDLLTDAGIAGEDIGILHHGYVRRGVLGDFQDTAPFGKLSASLLVLCTSLSQAVQTYNSKWVIGKSQTNIAVA